LALREDVQNKGKNDYEKHDEAMVRQQRAWMKKEVFIDRRKLFGGLEAKVRGSAHGLKRRGSLPVGGKICKQTIGK